MLFVTRECLCHEKKRKVSTELSAVAFRKAILGSVYLTHAASHSVAVSLYLRDGPGVDIERPVRP